MGKKVCMALAGLMSRGDIFGPPASEIVLIKPSTSEDR
eukprot:CAMPEP_0114692732 /NCGR_PEP_ID=MMETSP0191-20121206/68273_1 /TAXON_ID=126664 /ORGANISM="Sorites sp." /LENGTH=37 /DNA_ID= /DNA_START= /DNA_END= /DNA_ORIENTATION=